MVVLFEEKIGKCGIFFFVIDGEWVWVYEFVGGVFFRECLLKVFGFDRFF